MIQIFGTLGLTQEKILGNKFETGSTKDQTIKDKDVGEINKLIVKIDGNSGYRCKDIRITKGSNVYVFQCLKRLEPCTISSNPFICQEELLPEGDTAYEITLKTSNEEGAGTTSPMLIGLIGTKGASPYHMLSESGAESGSEITTVVKVNDLGTITGYYLEVTEPGKWKGSFMIVKTIKNDKTAQFDLKDIQLSNPGLSFKKFDTAPKANPNAREEDNSLKVNDKGLIGKTTGGFADLIKIPEEKADDPNDSISKFSKYETEANKPDIVDYNSSVVTSEDSKGNNINKVGGLIDQFETKGKKNNIYFC